MSTPSSSFPTTQPSNPPDPSPPVSPVTSKENSRVTSSDRRRRRSRLTPRQRRIVSFLASPQTTADVSSRVRFLVQRGIVDGIEEVEEAVNTVRPAVGDEDTDGFEEEEGSLMREWDNIGQVDRRTPSEMVGARQGRGYGHRDYMPMPPYAPPQSSSQHGDQRPGVLSQLGTVGTLAAFGYAAYRWLNGDDFSLLSLYNDEEEDERRKEQEDDENEDRSENSGEESESFDKTDDLKTEIRYLTDTLQEWTERTPALIESAVRKGLAASAADAAIEALRRNPIQKETTTSAFDQPQDLIMPSSQNALTTPVSNNNLSASASSCSKLNESLTISPASSPIYSTPNIPLLDPLPPSFKIPMTVHQALHALTAAPKGISAANYLHVRLANLAKNPQAPRFAKIRTDDQFYAHAVGEPHQDTAQAAASLLEAAGYVRNQQCFEWIYDERPAHLQRLQEAVEGLRHLRKGTLETRTVPSPPLHGMQVLAYDEDTGCAPACPSLLIPAHGPATPSEHGSLSAPATPVFIVSPPIPLKKKGFDFRPNNVDKDGSDMGDKNSSCAIPFLPENGNCFHSDILQLGEKDHVINTKDSQD
mmetsp:Transcript_10228/g.22685  ORF Transcript_10228/g.22685 Transcript_10228/m.22685 type:complete len:588 (-) Transcript_10228:137-1900(-)